MWTRAWESHHGCAWWVGITAKSSCMLHDQVHPTAARHAITPQLPHWLPHHWLPHLQHV